MKSVIIQCVDCPSTFEVMPAQQESFMTRFGELPKRCKSCRGKKRDKVAERDRRMNSPMFQYLPKERQEQVKRLQF